MADLLIVNKVQTADPVKVDGGARQLPQATTRGRGSSSARRRSSVDKPELIAGKRALVVEDGPTLTHGGMTYGAGLVRRQGRRCGRDRRRQALRRRVSIAATYKKYPNAGAILPAMGYSDQQIADLEATINATPCDVVVEGTPIDLTRTPQGEQADRRRDLRARGAGAGASSRRWSRT